MNNISIKESNITETSLTTQWTDFNTIVTRYGFEIVYEYEFQYNPEYLKTPSTERAALYYKEGLIIFITSHECGTMINSGRLYGEIKLKPNLSIGGLHCSHGMVDKRGYVDFNFDIRYGLIKFLDSLVERGELSITWKLHGHFLYFVDYMERRNKSFHHYYITMNKIMKCPPEVQQMLALYLQDSKSIYS